MFLSCRVYFCRSVCFCVCGLQKGGVWIISLIILFHVKLVFTSLLINEYMKTWIKISQQTLRNVFLRETKGNKNNCVYAYTCKKLLLFPDYQAIFAFFLGTWRNLFRFFIFCPWIKLCSTSMSKNHPEFFIIFIFFVGIIKICDDVPKMPPHPHIPALGKPFYLCCIESI